MQHRLLVAVLAAMATSAAVVGAQGAPGRSPQQSTIVVYRSPT